MKKFLTTNYYLLATKLKRLTPKTLLIIAINLVILLGGIYFLKQEVFI